MRFSHDRVRDIDFSPSENFMVTGSDRDHGAQQADVSYSFLIKIYFYFFSSCLLLLLLLLLLLIRT